MKIYNGSQASQLATMSEHVAAIRSLSDDLHAVTDGQLSLGNSYKVNQRLSKIKVECHILREHLKDMMPTLTDEKIV